MMKLKYDKVIFVEAFRNPYIDRRGKIFSDLGYECELWRWYKDDSFKKTLKENGPFKKFYYFKTEEEFKSLVDQTKGVEKIQFYTGVAGLYMGGVHSYFIKHCWEKSNLHLWPKEALFTLTNKHLTNCILRDLGITNNFFCKLNSSNYSSSQLEKIDSYPVIVKPIEGRGSMFVYKCENKKSLIGALEDYSQGSAKKVTDYSGGKVCISTNEKEIQYDAFHEVLIEDFAPGIEFSLDVYCDQGECEILLFLDKKVMVQGKASFYQEYMIAQNTRIPANVIERAKSWINAITTKLNHMSLFGHVEFIWDPSSDHLKLLEFNPREAGVLVANMIDLKRGLKIDQLSVQKALGEKIDIKNLSKDNDCYLALAIFQPKESGILVNVRGVNELKKKLNPNIFGLMKNYSIGKEIMADHEEYFLITLGLKANSNEELEKLYYEAKNLIEFEIEPFKKSE
ncbi:MAG: ATP-grasp domain-containing protein [Bdellovibrionales bacterium]|nr:ATP-grasp domain-containing protein [Bdellovibrionales bacterium]